MGELAEPPLRGRRTKLFRVLVVIVLVLVAASGTAWTYLVAEGRRINREYALHEYGDSSNKEVVESVKMAHHVMVENHDFERAEVLLNKAHSLEPSNRAVALNYAKVLAKVGKDDQAKKILTDLSQQTDYHGRIAKNLLDPATYSSFKRQYMAFRTARSTK